MKRIESESNTFVKQWKKLLTRKEREKSQMFLIEGPHLIEEALKYNIQVLHIIIEDKYIIPNDWEMSKPQVWVVPRKIIQSLSETEHPQGVIAVCQMPEVHVLDIQSSSKLLLIDGVQDPGNLGTIIRTADSAGIDGIILGEGTVDVYNGKVIRATQGSLFHLPVLKQNLFKTAEACKEAQLPLYATALENAADMRDQSLKKKGFALVVGNEGSGVQEKLLQHADSLVTIPIFGKAESLNVAVATGILLYEFQRDRL